MNEAVKAMTLNSLGSGRMILRIVEKLLESGKLKSLTSIQKSLYFRYCFINKIIDIAVIKLPRIFNFTDFDVFPQSGDVSARYVTKLFAVSMSNLTIILGTKSTIPDMKWLREAVYFPVMNEIGCRSFHKLQYFLWKKRLKKFPIPERALRR